MKRALLLSLLVAIFAMTAQAEQHILFNDNTRIGGFGGPMVYYTTFKGDGNVFVGGQGGMTINSRYYLGFFGGGIGHHPNAGNAMYEGTSRPTNYEMGYCGGLLGVILKGDDALHLTADVMIGGGTVNRHFDTQDWSDDHDRDHRVLKSDGFFAVQPMAHAEVNMFKWMRADLGAGYRFVSGVDGNGLTNEDLSGPMAGLSFRFGKF